ncbi:hypothetical protein NEIPOLOT_00492 [Neisseria polysaccharea ATCC 43768]|nr:hypothetical protein NEIPOLOT_00492 [Neisseria polysaccharea ATCC 43768]
MNRRTGMPSERGKSVSDGIFSSGFDGQTPILIRRGKQKADSSRNRLFTEKQFTVHLSMLYLHGI